MGVDALAAAASQMQASLASLAKAKGKGKGCSKGGEGKGKSQDGGKGNDKGKQKRNVRVGPIPHHGAIHGIRMIGTRMIIGTRVVGITRTPRVKAKVAKVKTLKVRARVRVRRYLQLKNLKPLWLKSINPCPSIALTSPLSLPSRWRKQRCSCCKCSHEPSHPRHHAVQS